MFFNPRSSKSNKNNLTKFKNGGGFGRHQDRVTNLYDYDGPLLQTNTPIILNTDFVPRRGGDSELLGIPSSQTSGFWYQFDQNNPDNPKMQSLSNSINM